MDVFSADWLGICRRCVAAQRAIFEQVRGIEARTVYEGVGEGGRPHPGHRPPLRGRRLRRARRAGRAGRLLRRRLRGARRGRVRRRRPGPGRDRPDRRLAQRPPHAALAQPQHRGRLRRLDGRRRVRLRLRLRRRRGVHRPARRGARCWTASRSRSPPTARSWSCSGSSRPSRSGPCPRSRRFAGTVYRLRVVGSIAITAAYVAAGRFDAMISLRPCRSVDAAAAQLIVREAGGVVAFGDGAAGARPRSASTPATRSPPRRASAALAIARAGQ